MSLLKKYGIHLLAAATIIAFALALWLIPQWQLSYSPESLSLKDRIQLENETRRTLAQIIGGAFIVIGVYLAWRRVITAERTVVISQEEQITERFTQAIEHLGNEKLQIRLGGIYALERIAKDSEKDYWQIVEVLTSHIRENAPWNEDQPPKKPPTDIQAVLTVLGRRIYRYQQGENLQLNLNRTDLRRVLLNDAHFEGANLHAAHLEESNLDRIYLEGANLFGAHLSLADLKEANLQNADLRDSNLQQADLEAANLTEADLREANLKGANFRYANLEKANLHKANLEGADFHGANLRGADLTDARMKGANFTEADLSDAWWVNEYTLMESIIDSATKPHKLFKAVEEARVETERLKTIRAKLDDVWKS